MGKFKKIRFSILATLLLLFIVASVACGNNNSNNTSSNNGDSPSSTPNTPAPDSSTPSKEDVTLKFTYWGSPIEKAAIEDVVRKFEEQYPHIQIDDQHIPNGEYVVKITSMMAGDIAPDIGYIGAEQGLLWAEEGKFLNLTDFMTRDQDKEYQPDEFLAPFSWEPDKILGFSAQSFAIYYNTDLFTQAGVELPPAQGSEAWEWDEFVETAKKLTIDRSGKNATEPGFDHTQIKQYGVQFEKSMNIWMNFVYSNEGQYLSEDGTTFALNEPAAVEAIQRVADLINVHHVSPSPTASKTLPAGPIALQSNQVAMILDGQWSLLDLGESKMNFGIGVLPKLKKSITQVVGGPTAIFSSTKHPDESWQFMKFLKSPANNLDLFVKGLWMPYTKSWYSDPELNAKWMEGNAAHPPAYKTAIAEQILERSVLAPTFYVKNYGSINAIVTPALDQVWTGEKTAEQALNEVADNAQAEVKGRYDVK